MNFHPAFSGVRKIIDSLWYILQASDDMRFLWINLWWHLGDQAGLADVEVIVIDRTNVNDPTQREGFWAYKLDIFIPKGLHIRKFL